LSALTYLSEIGKHGKDFLPLGGAALSALRYSFAYRAALAAEVIMAAPHRGNTGLGTYFITAATFQRNQLFQSERMAKLFIEVSMHYRSNQSYLLHEFVLMPDHFHLLLTPLLSLERSLQLIKGGFSYRVKKELGFAGEIWEKSFYDRRVRDMHEYFRFREYILQNPVKAGFSTEYPYSSAKLILDDVPQRLKPLNLSA